MSLQPKTTTLTLNSVPSGLTIAFNFGAVTTPAIETVIQNSQNTISAGTPQTLGGTTYDFSSWSDGGAATHVVTAPKSGTGASYAATYTAESGGGGGGGGGGGLPPDLTLAWSTKFPQVAVDGLNDLTATITNKGSVGSQQTHLRFTIPATLQLQGPPLYQVGSGCTGTTSVDCNLDYVANGGTTTVVVEVKALSAGTQTIQGTLTDAVDANLADNTASVSFDVAARSSPPPPPLPATIAVGSVTLPAAELLPGKKASASARVLDSSKHVIRPSRMSCTVKVAGRRVTAKATYRSSRVWCAFTIPAKTKKRATVVGAIQVATTRAKASRTFRASVR